MKDHLENYFIHPLNLQNLKSKPKKPNVLKNSTKLQKSQKSRYNNSKSALGYSGNHPIKLFEKSTEERHSRRRVHRVDSQGMIHDQSKNPPNLKTNNKNSHSYLKNASLAPTVGNIKTRKVKKTNKTHMTAKRLAPSALDGEEELDDTLLKSFYKHPNIKHLELDEVRSKSRKRAPKMKSSHRNKSRPKQRGKKNIALSQSTKHKKILISGKPTPEPKNYVIKDQYDFVSESETKTFDN